MKSPGNSPEKSYDYKLFLAKKGLLKQAFHLAHKIFPKGGTCLEFGVFRGNSYLYQALCIKTKYTASKLVGFDSWAGLPEENTSVWRPSVHAKGEYSSSKDAVLAKIRNAGMANDPRLTFVDGFFSDSCTPELRKTLNDIVFINIDVDIYQSTIELLDFVKPLLRPGVILYWDDWKDPRATHEKSWGEHLAWDHWTEKNPGIKAELIETNWVNQRFTVVTEANGQTLSDIGLTVEKVRQLSEDLETSTDKLLKSVVKSRPVSGFLKLGFQTWGKLRPL